MRSKHPGFTYDLVEGLSSRRSYSTASSSNPEPPDGGILPLLGDRPSQPSEAALFLLLGEGILGPLSPLSSGEERSIFRTQYPTYLRNKGHLGSSHSPLYPPLPTPGMVPRLASLLTQD